MNPVSLWRVVVKLTREDESETCCQEDGRTGGSRDTKGSKGGDVRRACEWWMEREREKETVKSVRKQCELGETKSHIHMYLWELTNRWRDSKLGAAKMSLAESRAQVCRLMKRKRVKLSQTSVERNVDAPVSCGLSGCVLTNCTADFQTPTLTSLDHFLSLTSESHPLCPSTSTSIDVDFLSSLKTMRLGQTHCQKQYF